MVKRGKSESFQAGVAIQKPLEAREIIEMNEVVNSN